MSMERPEQLSRIFRGSAMRKAPRKDLLVRIPSLVLIFSILEPGCSLRSSHQCSPLPLVEVQRGLVLIGHWFMVLPVILCHKEQERSRQKDPSFCVLKLLSS